MTRLDGIVREARARAQSAMSELVPRIDWPRDRLDAHRENALRIVLANAVERSSWHRDRLSGIDPSTFQLSELRSLPTMSKSDLMADFDAISTDARVTLKRCEEHIRTGGLVMDGEFVVFASGGTSGVRALGVERLGDLAEAWVGGFPRFVRRWATRTNAFSGPPRIASVGGVPGPHASHVLSKLFVGGEDGARFTVAQPLQEIVAGLNDANPDHLIAYSSFIPRLVDEARQGRLRIRPKLLSPVAEPLFPEHEEAAVDVWGSTVMMGWGATETTGLAAGSGFQPGMLLMEDRQIVEPVDAEGRPVAPGERAAKVLVTPLRERMLPIVRYELTDEVSLLEAPATCGSSFARVANVVGRLDDAFAYEGGIAVHPHLFRSVLAKHPAVTEYQVEQTARGAVVRAVLSSDAHTLDDDAIRREIRESLSHLGLPEAEVDVRKVHEIPRHERSGKLKRFVPLGAPGGPARVAGGVDA